MKLFITIFFLSSALHCIAQSINIVTPANETNAVTNAKQFITGTTCTNCIVTINNTPVKVYKTGVFAYQANLIIGINNFTVKSSNGKKVATKQLTYNYQIAKPIKETDSTIIETIAVEPSGNLTLQEGEIITIKVKAKPGCKLLLNDKYPLNELPKSQTKGVGGYYQASYQLQLADTVYKEWVVNLYQNNILNYTKIIKSELSIWQRKSVVGTTNMVNTPVYTGLGEDRLGGTKVGFLDSAVQVQLIGRIGNLYAVQLNKHFKVYIPTANISNVNEGSVLPTSLSNNITVVGDSLYDYVKISLNNKLPYLTTQSSKPTAITLDIYGATSNSNWLMQYPETLMAIDEVDLQQIADNKLRLTVNLKQKQLWGYKLYYEGNALVLQVRRQKNNLTLSNMVIAVDAGHGGSNTGARGISGRYEKEFTLLLAKELQQQLEAEGATVIMTRTSDISYENQERLTMLRKKMPDFAISIHLNSAGDPLRVKGVSTYYKYNCYKGLSGTIYKKVKETGLNGWGHIGNFNFFLNSPTEFPTALVETLFISNPEDEEKVHDASFRSSFIQKTVLGIKEWLAEIEK